MRPAELWDVGTGQAIDASEVRDRSCLALSSIAHPDDFEATLSRMGARVVGSLAFPDHHRYTERDRALIASEARSSEADAIITTEKDAVRLRAWRSPVRLLALGIEIEIVRGAGVLESAIQGVL